MMHRDPLLHLLRSYRASDAHESAMRDRIIAFIEAHPDCFERSLLVGHITGSAMIVNRQRTHTLLTHHGKLDKWLQLGGHSDGDPDTLAVARREAEEESGLRGLAAVSDEVFDVDVHPIPARKLEPEHFHYDVRFLFEADDAEPLVITSESKELAWVPLAELERYTTEESMLRMARKIAPIRN